MISTPTWATNSFHQKLAAHHAPKVFQGLGKDPVGDIFTRINFDGDFDAYNNWNNFEQAKKAGSSVYYDVIETKSHWFITYGFFYPRDYASICFWWVCHENDFEGMRITVEKSEAKFGFVVLLETLAHGMLHFDDSPVVDDDDHVAIVLEAGGHGVHSRRFRKPDSSTKIYTGNDYVLLPMNDLWITRHQVGAHKMWLGTFVYKYDSRLKDLPLFFGGTKWGAGGANPPWAWNFFGLKRGEWFFDPATSICHTYGCPTGLDSNYVYNPYLDSHSL